MTGPVRPSTKSHTNSDSLFGMALAQAFTGLAFGFVFDQAWEACEAASAVYQDRMIPARNTKPEQRFVLNEKRSLMQAFSREIEAPRPYGMFGISFGDRPFAPAPAI